MRLILILVCLPALAATVPAATARGQQAPVAASAPAAALPVGRAVPARRGVILRAGQGTAVAAALSTGRPAEIAAADSALPPELTLEVAPDGRLTAAGVLPSGLPARNLADALPGVELGAIRQSGTEARADWGRAAEGLSIVLPRFRQARAHLDDEGLAIRGELQRGFSATGVRAALVAALGRGWRLDLDLTETAPLADILFSKDGGGLVLSGLLPAGLDPAQALALLGPGAAGDGLAGGGAGDAGNWARSVAALGAAAALFDTARGSIADGEVAVSGVLRPGYPAGAVAARLAAAVPQGWSASVEARETPASEGDRRTGLDSGAPEVFRRGFWLPEVDFPVSPERCTAEADAALERGQVRFEAGSARLDASGSALIDRLAAIAVRCLNSSDMALEIAGHTDSVGNDAANQALSQARAAAVREALVERGVRAESVTASGYGESSPVASNNTAEGRASNRRIAFTWSGS